MILKSPKLESYAQRFLSVGGGVLLGILVLLLIALEWPLWLGVCVTACSALFVIVAIKRFTKNLVVTFERAILQIDAIQSEDYTQYAKPAFTEGKVGEFHDRLDELSEELFSQKSRYDQHVFLVYRLIDQLSTPILVFNQNAQLVYANGAFSTLYNQPWQMYRHASTQKLGLSFNGSEWRLKNSSSQWEIKTSSFLDKGETHELLVFIDISSALRESQLDAWQQLIRVLGHEIRNTLTPISSISEVLAEKSQTERDKKALSIITERCQHLQDFVGRYSVLTQNPKLHCESILINDFVHRIQTLFSELALAFDSDITSFWADVAFTEQVFINLIKNACEAGATHVKISFNRKKNSTVISLIDNGHGFSNLENLFVPLYSTKEQGQGIGLSFCRSVVEQHGGSITLENANRENSFQSMSDGCGVCVTITLPNQSPSSS